MDYETALKLDPSNEGIQQDIAALRAAHPEVDAEMAMHATSFLD